jgi:Fe-S cluster assembly protein SufD
MSVSHEDSPWLSDLVGSDQAGISAENHPWLKVYREDALHDLKRADLPNRKQERWRYTPTANLMKQDFVTAACNDEKARAIDVQQWFTPGLDAYRLVFVNGCCSPSCCQVDGLHEDAHIGSLRAAMNTDEEIVSVYLGTIQDQNEELFGLLNQAMINDGLFMHIKAGVRLEKPIEVVYLSDSAEQSLLVQPRGLIVMEQGAEATLIEHHVGAAGARYFNNNQIEILVHEQAHLRHYRIQDESRSAFHIGGIQLLQHAASRYESVVFSLGGGWARTEINGRYAGEQAETRLQGLYLVGDQQVNDIHLDIIHNLPACHSEETFKGLLYGKGRAVFDGRILVEQDAQKTEAHLSNNNLMLTRESEVDTKPQLEIYADDVKCSHGTTVGQIEEEQIFYLRSRGIEEQRARAMLSMGFVGEVVEQLDIEPLKEALMASIEQRVDVAMKEKV